MQAASLEKKKKNIGKATLQLETYSRQNYTDNVTEATLYTLVSSVVDLRPFKLDVLTVSQKHRSIAYIHRSDYVKFFLFKLAYLCGNFLRTFPGDSLP